MTAAELLEHLAPSSPRRDEAAVALMGMLSDLARGQVKDRNRVAYRIEPGERDEMVGLVALKVIEKSPLAVAEKGDLASRAYLERMLAHRWIDHLRQQRRIALDSESLLEKKVAPEAGDEPERVDAARHEAKRLLDAAVEAMVLEKRAHHRDGVRGTWRELSSVVFDGISIQDLVDRELGPDGSAAKQTTVRNKLFRRHFNLRRYLAEWLDKAATQGHLTRDQVDTYRELLRFLLRCQQREPSSVEQGEGSSQDESAKARKSGSHGSEPSHS